MGNDGQFAMVGDGTHEHNLRPAYRSAIDGLRAIAILPVLAFHAAPQIVRGGFVGVDIFFVISGYLISSIVFKSLENGRFRFSEFYARRIRRLFPALLLVVAASYCVGWAVLLPDEFAQLGKHIVGGVGYVQNFVLVLEAGYFDAASELKPLLHLWSLAIEEQFYLVYPLLLWLAWRFGIRVVIVPAFLLVASFGLNLFDVGRSPIKAFFLPHTRFWELVAGSLLAYLTLSHTTRLSGLLSRTIALRKPAATADRRMHYEIALSDATSVAGLLAISAAVLLIHRDSAFPGWWALLPVAGAFLLILAGPQAVVNRTILANGAMVFIGLISYPLYLWHWPALSFAHVVEGAEPSPVVRWGAVLASFVLAWMTYLLAERPIRSGRVSGAGVAGLVTLSIVAGGVGFFYILGKRASVSGRAGRRNRERRRRVVLPGGSRSGEVRRDRVSRPALQQREDDAVHRRFQRRAVLCEGRRADCVVPGHNEQRRIQDERRMLTDTGHEIR